MKERLVTKTCTGWIDYFSHDNLTRSEFYSDTRLEKVNAELFFRRAQGIVEFRKDDSVLNIGCGVGHLERLLAPMVKSIHAVDVCGRFVTLCRENCREYPNVSAALLGPHYTDLSRCGGPYSLILCLAVVMFYRNLGELEALIKSARDIAVPGARMLITDIFLQRRMAGSAWDALCSLLMSVREGYLGSLLLAAYDRYLRRSRYHSFLKKVSYLYCTVAELESLIERLGLEAAIIRENLTVGANRPSLLIRF